LRGAERQNDRKLPPAHGSEAIVVAALKFGCHAIRIRLGFHSRHLHAPLGSRQP
jgi:hypothetical protein